MSESRDDVILNVHVVDAEFGDEEDVSVLRGDYLILCTKPAYISNIQAHSNGTHVITVKGRLQA